MNRFASTRSENRDSQPAAGRAQWSVASIEDDGIRYGLITHALIASTIATAPTMVTIQSTAMRSRRGKRPVTRSSGWWNSCALPLGSPEVEGGGSGHENGGAGGGGSYGFSRLRHSGPSLPSSGSDVTSTEGRRCSSVSLTW